MKASVIWLTGFSGAGKTTLALELGERMRKANLPVEVLDGDEIRKINPGIGFSRQERNAHVRTVGFLASVLERNGINVIVALVSPYRESRDFSRGLCRNFCEVHVSTPLSECERRDVKGIYQKARRGEIKGLTGIDDPYEAPLKPEITVDTSSISVTEAAERILGRFGHGPSKRT